MTSKCLHFLYDMTHDYTTTRIKEYHPPSTLRSGDASGTKDRYALLNITFSVSAPRLWNSIPFNLKCAQGVDILKKYLNTYLFKIN